MLKNIIYLYSSDFLRIITGVFAGVLIVRSLSGVDFLSLMQVQAIGGIFSIVPFYLIDQFLVKDFQDDDESEAFYNILVFKLKLGFLAWCGGTIFVSLIFPDLYPLFAILSLNFFVMPFHSFKFFDLLNGRAQKLGKSLMGMHIFQFISINVVTILAPTVINYLILNVIDNVLLVFFLMISFRGEISRLSLRDLIHLTKKSPSINFSRGLIIFIIGMVDLLLPRFLLLIGPYFHTLEVQASFAVFTRFLDSVSSGVNSLNTSIFLRRINRKGLATERDIWPFIYILFVFAIVISTIIFGNIIINFLYQYEAPDSDFGLVYFLTSLPVILVLKFIISDRTGRGDIESFAFLIFGCFVSISGYYLLTSYVSGANEYLGLIFSGFVAFYTMYAVYVRKNLKC